MIHHFNALTTLFVSLYVLSFVNPVQQDSEAKEKQHAKGIFLCPITIPFFLEGNSSQLHACKPEALSSTNTVYIHILSATAICTILTKPLLRLSHGMQLL